MNLPLKVLEISIFREDGELLKVSILLSLSIYEEAGIRIASR